MRRSNFEIVRRLIGLVRPLLAYMLLAIFLGVLGFLAAIAIPVIGMAALLGLAGHSFGIALTPAFILIALCAISRGLLRYGEQLCNHYIAFKLLALIRDKVFKALRRLSPAKMETKDKGNLITVLTSDIELLEVFYAHTISPVAIATLTSLVLLGVFLFIHPLLALIALLAYVTIGLVLPFFTSKAGKASGTAYREESGNLSSYVLDSLRGIREILQYNQGPSRLDDIQRRTKGLGKTQSSLKKTEGLSSALAGALIMLFSLAILSCGLWLSSLGLLDVGGAILAFALMISSLVRLANKPGNNLVHIYHCRILDEEPLTHELKTA